MYMLHIQMLCDSCQLSNHYQRKAWNDPGGLMSSSTETEKQLASDFCLQWGHIRAKLKNLKITCFYDFMAPRKWKPLI